MSTQPTSRVAVVSGGSRGLGRAICHSLATAGARVVVNYANRLAPAQETVGEITARSSR